MSRVMSRMSVDAPRQGETRASGPRPNPRCSPMCHEEQLQRSEVVGWVVLVLLLRCSPSRLVGELGNVRQPAPFAQKRLTILRVLRQGNPSIPRVGFGVQPAPVDGRHVDLAGALDERVKLCLDVVVCEIVRFGGMMGSCQRRRRDDGAVEVVRAGGVRRGGARGCAGGGAQGQRMPSVDQRGPVPAVSGDRKGGGRRIPVPRCYAQDGRIESRMAEKRALTRFWCPAMRCEVGRWRPYLEFRAADSLRDAIRMLVHYLRWQEGRGTARKPVFIRQTKVGF